MTDKFWAVKGRWSNGREFLYCGTYLTRADAKECHAGTGRTWEQCYANNDRAVRVTVTEVVARKQAKPARAKKASPNRRTGRGE